MDIKAFFIKNRSGANESQSNFFLVFTEEGNQTLVRTETGDWQVTWNAEKRPVSFTRGNERVECVYDYMGRRVRKTQYRDDVPVSRRLFVYNGYRLVAELDDMEEADGQTVTKTWLWDPVGVFDNSPLEMQVWKEEEGYPEVSSSSSEGTTEYPTTAYPEGSSSSEGTTDYPETEYPQSLFPEGHFFRSADLLMRDRDEWTVTVTTYEDHLELSLDRELFTRGDVCLDRIELVLPDVYPYMESKEIRAIVHLNEQVIVKGEWKGEKLHLDLTNSGLSPKRLVPETGEIRMEFQKRKQPGTDEEWEAVAGLAYKGDVKAMPLAHVSGAILKRKNSSPSEYATTDYPTTDYPSESSSESSSSESNSSFSEGTAEYPFVSSSESSSSEAETSSSESGFDSCASVSNGISDVGAISQRARLFGVGLSSALSIGEHWKRYYYLNDGNRNIIALRTPEGEICTTYTYGTYGQCLKTTGTGVETNPFRYSSEYYDQELGMIYYNYRHYNPLDGRWLSRDPMEEQGGTNLYGFCSNDPMSKIDQLGLSDLPGASSTGLSTHWGNIVREKQPWAIVCYKYYEAAKELGVNAERDIWELLAKANKLNYEERDKWVKGYKPLPEPGDLFQVPNTFVIYTTIENSISEMMYTHMMQISRRRVDRMKDRFKEIGVYIEENQDCSSDFLFLSLWKTEGIFGFSFVGHGCDATEIGMGWIGVLPISRNDNISIMPKDVKPPYALSFIAMLSCGSIDMGWGKSGSNYPLSRDGVFIGYSGAHSSLDEDIINFKNAMKPFTEIWRLFQ